MQSPSQKRICSAASVPPTAPPVRRRRFAGHLLLLLLDVVAVVVVVVPVESIVTLRRNAATKGRQLSRSAPQKRLVAISSWSRCGNAPLGP